MTENNNKKQARYNPQELETKWQKKWTETNLYTPDITKANKPFFNLMMFPYPSAEGLHVGNMYAFTGADVYGRYQRMLGYDVFEPIGLDGFGIHSENYAIKVGRHPKEHAKISEANFYRQLGSIGNGFAWEHRLETYDPNYYRWTQWLFIQMWKKGLAYKGVAKVNWCPTCKTVLADEQVVDGKCERTGDTVERREMSSWYFKITQYADRLLQNIETIVWPEKIKIAQRQWIGKSNGLSIDFEVEGLDTPIVVWTKFWETIFGTTFLVLAPEHWSLEKLAIPENRKTEVETYIKQALNKSEQDRKASTDKSGVFTGLYAKNPVNGNLVPIWVADYVLPEVGTGAVMGVPAHDTRDFDFAKKYDLPTIQVVAASDEKLNAQVQNGEISFEGDGNLINSGTFDGQSASALGKANMADWMIKSNFARWQVHYHLRDWLISRQRYWGPPIPMVYCGHCARSSKGEQSDMPGWYAVAESDLPVVLPDIEDFKPKGDGTSPLSNASDEWKFTKCPFCGENATRELDVSDTFLDSSWYFLRYPSVGTQSSASIPFDIEITKKWLPVNAYIGGAEHAVLHLLYARFVTMVLKDIGRLNFEEPFPFLFGHGLIIKDGAKMSKSKGNVVIPDEYIAKFGSDTLRSYLMFLGPFDQGGDFRDTGIEGMYRFLQRVWDLAHDSRKEPPHLVTVKMHQTIKKVGTDLAQFKYNTALAAIMEYVNVMREKGASDQHISVLAQLIAPFAPFLSEEIWTQILEKPFSVHKSQWPSYDDAELVEKEATIVVQVNGKLRSQLVVEKSLISDQSHIESLAKSDPKVIPWVENKTVRNIIYVEGKLINFVVS